MYRIEYRIVKNNVSGGNNANVYWHDYGVAPAMHESTGSGIQDGAWHTLREANYYRGSGGTSFFFTFDRSGSTDPECGEAFPL